MDNFSWKYDLTCELSWSFALSEIHKRSVLLLYTNQENFKDANFMERCKKNKRKVEVNKWLTSSHQLINTL